MAKSSKSKKLQTLTEETSPTSGSLEQEVVAIDTVQTEEVVVDVVKQEQVVEEVKSTIEPVQVVLEEPIIAQVTQTALPTRRIGKVVVGERFLVSNPTFFTWLHKQGYAILDRTPIGNGNVGFTIEGGTLDPVSGEIPEYLLSVGSYLSLKRK
jgi:hypothetical protein